MSFTLRVPVSENPHLRSSAPVVSRHASLGEALEALRKEQSSTDLQGYHSEAYIWDEEANCLASEAELARIA
jgi:hypothetical protein